MSFGRSVRWCFFLWNEPLYNRNCLAAFDNAGNVSVVQLKLNLPLRFKTNNSNKTRKRSIAIVSVRTITIIDGDVSGNLPSAAISCPDHPPWAAACCLLLQKLMILNCCLGASEMVKLWINSWIYFVNETGGNEQISTCSRINNAWSQIKYASQVC